MCRKRFDTSFASYFPVCRADTLVATEDGGVPIAEIEVGDEVLAYDEATGEVGEYTVTDTISHIDPEIVLLVIDGEYLETTREHPFYTDEGEWVDAEDLEIGEEIRNLDGDYGIVESVEVITVSQAMYNLTVDTAHTFFDGEGEWLVHNQTGGSVTFSRGVYPQSGTPPMLDGILYKPNNPLTRDILDYSGLTRNRRNAGTALATNLELAGYPNPQAQGLVQWQPHHIVPFEENNEFARKARDLITDAGIDLNSAANGVWLPWSQTRGHDSIVTNRFELDVTPTTHSRVHNKKYFEEVYHRLKPYKNNQQGLIDELQRIGDDILVNNVPCK